jgi:hypothetical protein
MYRAVSIKYTFIYFIIKNKINIRKILLESHFLADENEQFFPLIDLTSVKY